MFQLDFQTLVIIVLVSFIVGVLIGVDHGKPGPF